MATILAFLGLDALPSLLTVGISYTIFNSFWSILGNYIDLSSLYTWPPVVHDAVTYFAALLWKWDFLLPVNDLLTIMLMVMTLKFALAMWYLLKTAVGFIRGVPVLNPFTARQVL